MKAPFFVIFSLLFVLSTAAEAQSPRVGRKAASRYFQRDVEPSRELANQKAVEILDNEEPPEVNNEDQAKEIRRAPRPISDSYLMLHLGGFTSSFSHDWNGSGKRTGVGKSTYGVTYLYNQWENFDVHLRADFIEYSVGTEDAKKLSLLPVLTFPLVDTRFPLYFGLGAGLGVFFSQVDKESSISLDYQLFAGARFIDVFDGLGFFVEFGLKNHLHLLSNGQFSGTSLAVGGIFNF